MPKLVWHHEYRRNNPIFDRKALTWTAIVQQTLSVGEQYSVKKFVIKFGNNHYLQLAAISITFYSFKLKKLEEIVALEGVQV